MRDLVRFRFQATSSTRRDELHYCSRLYLKYVLIINSTVQDNLFFEANFVSLNMSQTAYDQLPSPPSTVRLLKVLYITSTSFVKNYLYATTLIQSSNPQVYIHELRFLQDKFHRRFTTDLAWQSAADLQTSHMQHATSQKRILSLQMTLVCSIYSTEYNQMDGLFRIWHSSSMLLHPTSSETSKLKI